jgi:erythromycin esterase-like protein
MREPGRDRDGGLSVRNGGVAQMITRAAEPLPEVDDTEFARAFDRFGDARVVLLGEASHGTSEFYRARAAITRWLIEQRGFTVVALEADWPDARALDAFARGKPRPLGAGQAFRRFPTWMWRNREFDQFLTWLKGHNARRGERPKAGIYGLDLYNLSASMRAVIGYLDQVDPQAAEVARRRYGCLTPWADEPAAYGKLALTSGYARCERPVTAMLSDLLARQAKDMADEGQIDAAQNARLVRDAEAYYRVMYYGGAESWNLRDTHMFETLDALLAAKGSEAKAVVWAHNAHIGDARATEMGVIREELNLGQLCRQAWGREAALIGFGTHGGTVACASDWDAPMEVKSITPGLGDSWEALSHAARTPSFLLDLRAGRHEALRAHLLESRLERFIGVVYRPETERWSHYVDCKLAQQFDAWVWFDQTTAVTPLRTPARAQAAASASTDETWPFGL